MLIKVWIRKENKVKINKLFINLKLIRFNNFDFKSININKKL